VGELVVIGDNFIFVCEMKDLVRTTNSLCKSISIDILI